MSNFTLFSYFSTLTFNLYKVKDLLLFNLPQFVVVDNVFAFMSFRLAEERQAIAKENLQQPATEDHRQKMLDSLSSAGVDNFTMKAAVPGSEVPGHKVGKILLVRMVVISIYWCSENQKLPSLALSRTYSKSKNSV